VRRLALLAAVALLGSADSAAKPGFVVRQGNLIVAGSTSRWPGVEKALANLR
jgi:hypothetical protein